MSKQAEAGKGSKPRKQQDQDAYSSGWDRIFGKKEQKDQPTKGANDGSKKAN